MVMRKAVGNSAGYRGRSIKRLRQQWQSDRHPTYKTVQYNIMLNKNKLKENTKLMLNR